jgi:hypothetical protein
MRILTNNKGNSLALVLVILIFFTTISLAIIPAAQVSYTNAVNQQLSQQAYFNARTAADTMFSYLNNNSDKLTNILNSKGAPTNTTNGDFDVTVKPDTDGISGDYMITAIGYSPNRTSTIRQTSKVVEHIKQTSNTPLPTDSIIYQNGALTNFNCFVTGDIFVNGKFTLGRGDNISGKIIALDDVTISGGSSTIGGGIYTTGSISLSGGANVTSNCFSDDFFSIEGGSHLIGNIITNNSFTDNGTNVKGNVTCFANATFDGGSNNLTGNINSGGIYYFPWGTISSFVSGNALQHQNITKYDFSSIKALAVPSVVIPANIKNLSKIPATILINTSGQIDSSNFTGSDVTIDTSAGNINLLINTNTEIKNTKVYVTGTNNVYIYLTGSSSLTLDGGNNRLLAMKSNVDDSSNIYILGDGSQTVTTASGALRATIYMPLGTFAVSGSDPSSFSPAGNDPIPTTSNSFIFRGSAVVKSSNLTAGVHIKYVQPDVSVLATLIPGYGSTSGSGGSGFSIRSWSNS